MSSSICPHFTQNAWKKDLCSNCFKSKDEHRQAQAQASAQSAPSRYSSLSASARIAASLAAKATASTAELNRKTDYPNKNRIPMKSSIKKHKSTSTATATKSRTKSHRVTFPKNLAEVIGYGGEWSDPDYDDDDDDDDHDFMNLGNERDDTASTSTDDEETLELKRITRANTDFNMNNGSLLGDPHENIKKSFAALKLGAPQVDKEGKKQTLKINVLPFGATATATDSSKQMAAAATAVKAKFETKSVIVTKSIKQTANIAATATKTEVETTTVLQEAPNDSDGKNSPPIERAMEKSLLDEISETLEQNQKQSEAIKDTTVDCAPAPTPLPPKMKFEIGSLSESLESSKPFLDFKKPIARNAPITKEHAKPKINVFHKFSDTDSNCSDSENGVSAYYDVVETELCYENVPDGKCCAKAKVTSSSPAIPADTATDIGASDSAADERAVGSGKTKKAEMFSSSQYITDMLLSSKTRAASYSLHEGNFMTSTITSDGLIVTKCSSDDALDSTGSSFDGSSDEETSSYNMMRSESDSGIGISLGSNGGSGGGSGGGENERERQRIEKKLSASTNNSDYEDIQVVDQRPILPKPNAKATFSLEKSRELHGEPDGSADPDNSLEAKVDATATSSNNKNNSAPAAAIADSATVNAGVNAAVNTNANSTTATGQQAPALPKSPPPTKTIDARPSFLHSLQKQHPTVLLKKPDLPAKPLVSQSALKTFIAKRSPAAASAEQHHQHQQQMINQLQLVMSKSSQESLAVAAEAAKDDAKLKKGRAPNPPPEHKASAPPTPDRDYNVLIEFGEGARSLRVKPKEGEASAPENQQPQSAPEAIRSQSHSHSHSHSPPGDADAKTSGTTDALEAIKSMGAGTTASIYTRKLPTPSSAAANGAKNTASPVIREKDKRERERATINPKFRSLNTFVTQRSNAAKNQQLQSLSLLKQPLTPEPTPKSHKNLFMSQQCLASSSSLSLNAPPPASPLSQPSPKTKSKFSIKKFLRMGASKSTDHHQLHKHKDAVYSEICTGDEAGVAGKPRLVIIHPIDINPTAVEVVKDITKTNDAVLAQTVAVVTAKPPAPPLRAADGQRPHEINKPARPPPPKSVELRRKQKSGLSTLGGVALEAGGSVKCKSDNVYANLGEIRSSIAPRKPERTASMREREAQLELARKRHVGVARNENADTISICSSNGDHVSAEQQQQQHQQQQQQQNSTHNGTNLCAGGGKPPSGSRTSTFERRKSDPKIAVGGKLEIYENRSSCGSGGSAAAATNFGEGRPSSLKDSVRKINSTIDSYLKDKHDYEHMYDELVKGAVSPPPPPPPVRSAELNGGASGGQRLLPPRRKNLYSDTVSVASYTRSEYGPARQYGLNASLANIPRIISASYCGSEVGEFEIYSPYSYYGSEAGGDVATDINDSVWGVPSSIKNRTKATNRLRMRKGRSVVHKTIEDNYTAVVVANHEALAQVLDQMQQTPIIPSALRPLANAINLRFEDFTILDGAQAFVVGKKAFHAALWTTAPVTLALSADCNQLAGVGGELNQLSGGVSGVLNPITEFCDLVPSYHLPLMPSTAVTLLQTTISVLPRLQLDTLQSIGAILKGKSHVLDKSNFNFRGSIPNLAGLKEGASSGVTLRNVVSVQNLSTLNEESLEKCSTAEEHGPALPTATAGMPAFDDVMTREVAFIMLQLVNGLKNLQAKAIEELPLSLSNVVLSKDVENKDAQARLCVLHGSNSDEEEPMGTLCKCAHVALTEMLPVTKITAILANILAPGLAESLSKSKSVLEFVLWGPSDVVLSGSTKERELALQRWLDLERATVLHGLVRTRVELTVYDECHLMFLVRSTAKMMNEAAKIVFSYQQKLNLEHPPQ